MATKRRDFLKLLGLLGLSLHASRGKVVLAADEGSIAVRDALRTGTLTPSAKLRMWRVFEYIGSAWQNGADLNVNQSDFFTILDLKTNEAPSYLAEYRDFLTHLESLVREHGEAGAMRRLFFEDPDPRRKKFVIAELIELQLASGGFRVLGWKNFKGFPNGPFGLAGEVPYRVRPAR